MTSLMMYSVLLCQGGSKKAPYFLFDLSFLLFFLKKNCQTLARR